MESRRGGQGQKLQENVDELQGRLEPILGKPPERRRPRLDPPVSDPALDLTDHQVVECDREPLAQPHQQPQRRRSLAVLEPVNVPATDPDRAAELLLRQAPVLAHPTEPVAERAQQLAVATLPGVTLVTVNFCAPCPLHGLEQYAWRSKTVKRGVQEGHFLTASRRPPWTGRGLGSLRRLLSPARRRRECPAEMP